MTWHEIVKYSPENYDEKGVYTKDEWTSRSDVGKCYDGKPFAIEEYLDVEQHHINVICAIMDAANCKCLTIRYIEADKAYVAKRIKSSRFHEMDSPLLKSIPLLEEKRRIYSKEELSDIIRLALRKYIYVELSNKERKLLIEFGYDYYLKVSCSLSDEVLGSLVRKEMLFLDPR